MKEKNEVKISETTRLEMFSDGVFAIAITLLVLELITTLHPDSGERLLDTLRHHWQTFVAFIIGFVTILICWINHHIALEFIQRVDTGFMWVNGFLLFVVTLTPFSTAILAQYLEQEGSIAVALFAFNYILISLAAHMISNYAYQRHLVYETERAAFYPYTRMYKFGILYNAIALGLSFVSIIIPLIMFTVLFFFFATPRKLAARVRRPPASAGD